VSLQLELEASAIASPQAHVPLRSIIKGKFMVYFNSFMLIFSDFFLWYWGFELRAYTLSHSTSPFFVMDFFEIES
jgi:hypothetical protein